MLKVIDQILARSAFATLLFGVAVLQGCGGGGAADDASLAPVPAADYQALGEGHRWVYRVTSDDPNDPEHLETVRVASVSRTGDQTRWRLDTHLVTTGDLSGSETVVVSPSGTQVQDSELDDASGLLSGAAVLRLPSDARIGGRYKAAQVRAASLGQDLDGDARNDSVDATAELTIVGLASVVSDAGEFDGALHTRTVLNIKLVLTGGGAIPATLEVEDWWVPDIGLARQTSMLMLDGVVQRTESRLVAFAAGTRRSDAQPPAVIAAPSESVATTSLGQLPWQFGELIDLAPGSRPRVVLTAPDGSVMSGEPLYAMDSLVYAPPPGIRTSGTYSATLQGVSDLLGNVLPARTWQVLVDSDAPRLVGTSIPEGMRYVDTHPTLQITFDEPVNDRNFRWLAGFGSVLSTPVETSIQGSVLTLRPLVPLLPDTVYEVSVTGLSDAPGNSVDLAALLTFRTDPGAFDYPVLQAADGQAQAVAAADVDGDGRIELVVAYGPAAADQASRLVAFRRLPDGRMSEFWSSDLQRGSVFCMATSVATGDFNGDGRIDLAAGTDRCGLEIFHQRSDGGFDAPLAVATDDASRLVSADLDRDGRTDLVGVGRGLSLWRQVAGGMGPVRVLAQGYDFSRDVAVGDLNGDGRPDIAVITCCFVAQSGVNVLIQQSDGSFAPPVVRQWQGTLNSMSSIAIGDFNGDGRNDIVTGFWFGHDPLIALQSATGTLGELTMVTPVPSDLGALRSFQAVDVDADGRVDVVARAVGEFVVWRQASDGSLGPIERYHDDLSGGQAEGAQGLAVADLNGDGRVDLISAELAIRLGRSSASQRSTDTVLSIRAPGTVAKVPARERALARWRQAAMRR